MLIKYYHKCKMFQSYFCFSVSSCDLHFLFDTKICALIWFEEVTCLSPVLSVSSMSESVHSFNGTTATILL